MRSVPLVTLGLCIARASAETYRLEAGDDFGIDCLMKVEPGDTCYLEKGDYEHDGLTRTHGTADNRITITGDSEACIKGSNTQDRVLQIAHDYYTIEGLCFDGQHGDNYVATAIYALGADKKSDLDKNGVIIESSVTGLQLFDLEIKNFASECVHFRYSVTWAEVQGCTVQHCGIEAFEKGLGSKVGECFYVGTALDQVDDNKAPEPKLRTGGSDNVVADYCGYNWIHHNTMRSYGNECVDVKEGSANNVIEHNVCEQQKDPNSGGFGLRGSDNTVRWNEIAECEGAGIRMGGDNGFGQANNIYGNIIKNTNAGAFSVMSPNQGTVCENQISGVDRIAFGSESSDQSQFLEENATGPCLSYPGDLPGITSSSESAPAEDDNEAGVNYTEEAKQSDPEIVVVETNEAAGSSGQGECETVLQVSKVSVEHPQYVDSATTADSLFDGDIETYYSVNRETTKITFELEEETEVNGVAIGFFMKIATEERIQTFDIAVRKATDDDWITVISRKVSSGVIGTIETFPFSARTALYVRFESHGNDFNNWTALTELEICGKSAGESNAVFGGVKAIGKELEMLAGEVCAEPTKIGFVKVAASGNDNVRVMFDNSFETRWSTVNTQNESDMSNDKVKLTFAGDTRVSKVKIAFFDGHLAHQHFSVYTQSASAHTWTPVLLNEIAEKTEVFQSFSIEKDHVHILYIVGNGNDVGFFTKISEIEVTGC